MPKKFLTILFASLLIFSMVLTACAPSPVVEETEVVVEPDPTEEPEVEEMDLVIVEEETLEEHENPLTNSVPSAVILGAGDVPEEQAEESLPEVEVVEEVVEESYAM